jgi:quercetin dioxygenase-like cupin family protein
VIRDSPIVTVANTRQAFGKQPMQLTKIPFGTTDWAKIPSERKYGETGWADWKVGQFGDVRVRMLQYSPGYKADHWCLKGHILFCLEGELLTELKDGRKFVLHPGMSYQVADGAEPHRSSTQTGARLFVVD